MFPYRDSEREEPFGALETFLFHPYFEIQIREDIHLKSVCGDLLKSMGAMYPLPTQQRWTWYKAKQSPSSAKEALFLPPSLEQC